MILVMTSSFRHRTPSGGQIDTQIRTPGASWPDFGVRRGWVEPPGFLKFRVVSAHSLKQGHTL